MHALVIQSDGKIVVGGIARASSSGGRNFALARYTAGGALDTTQRRKGPLQTHPCLPVAA